LIRLGYCLGVKSVVSIKETIMYQLEASKKNPKSSQSLQGRATNRFFVLSLDLPYQFGISLLILPPTTTFTTATAFCSCDHQGRPIPPIAPV